MTENKDISRRNLLKGIISGFILTAAGVGLRSRDRNTSTNSTQNQTPSLTETQPSPEVLSFNQDGIKVWFREGIPTRWEDQSSQGEFDTEKLLEAKRQGEEDGDHKVAQVVRVTSSRATRTPTPEVEIATEGIKRLPENIVEVKELSERGIEILDSQNVGFHIRQSAFEEGGLMAQYQRGGDRRLKILITDKPTILQETFRDERYDSARDVIQKALPTVADADMFLQAHWQSGNDVQRQLREQSLHLITQNEIANWGLMGITGYSIKAGLEQGSTDTDYLFLAIGKKSKDQVVLNVSR